jgi:uncharacterized protein YndB with AHSA1/START domain
MAVKFEQKIDIDAPGDKVWGIITNPNTWSMWLPEVTGEVSVSNFAPGGTFTWRNGDSVGNGSIVDINERSSIITLITQDDNIPVTHTIDVDRSGGFLGIGGNDSRVKYVMEYDPPGGFISDFVAGGNPKDMLRLKNALTSLKKLVEG